MADFIHIDGLLLRAILGINPDERVNKQDVVIDLKLAVETRPAAASDDIADAVNYRTLTKDIIAMVEASQFQLVERLAEEVARLCLSDSRVSDVVVTVHKPGAVRFARSVAVCIERSRNQ